MRRTRVPGDHASLLEYFASLLILFIQMIGLGQFQTLADRLRIQLQRSLQQLDPLGPIATK